MLAFIRQDIDEMTNDEHLIQINEIIGPLPEFMTSQWRRAGIYYDEGGNLRLDSDPQCSDTGAYNNDQFRASMRRNLR
jgi:hypothetical protein